jgi:hypothetical protein
MLSEYEASILTRFRQNNRTSGPRSLGRRLHGNYALKGFGGADVHNLAFAQ